MGAVTEDRIRVECGFAFHDILDFEIKEDRNTHTIVRIRGTVPEEIGQSLILQKLEGNPLSVYIKDGEKQDVLFCGFIQTLQIGWEGNGYTAELKGISGTELLTVKRKAVPFRIQT